MSRTEPAGTPLGDRFHLYDTTLRDGAQREGISYSIADKFAVARLLDDLGVGFIEGGWPGAMPKDTEFFARAAAGELTLRHAVLVAFGSTRRAGLSVTEDPQVRALLDSQAPVVTLVAKSDVRHIERAFWATRHASPYHREALGKLLPELIGDAQLAAAQAEDDTRRKAQALLSEVYS